MSGWVRVLRGAALLGLAIAAYFVVPVSGDVNAGAVGRIGFAVVVVGLLTATILWQLARQRDDPDARVDGLLLALVGSILAFALWFYRLAVVDPSEVVGLHTRLDALYFTMSTLLTIGYGDIHAAGQTARGVALVQMVFNVVVLATAAPTLSSRLRARAAARAGQRAHPRSDPVAGGRDAPRRGARRRRGR